jgi:hypothetical protein
MMPPLPPRSGKVEFTYLLNGVPTEGEITFHSEEDFIAYGRQCVEAADEALLRECLEQLEYAQAGSMLRDKLKVRLGETE